ncbi:hypothetical protein HYDPIDRAFT_167402 [Hydnomerulius pinastri MD-312]|uniref:Uncharacterized protein n=1 Tax=Hydnomerulius pinastri MD-312 TaxID=994086 RepID=A0A0C9WGB1_9AGAM|nr:hypothetical protein HYDPIDRAFT_167402 [Hydnomerulius pinastri MD-312]
MDGNDEPTVRSLVEHEKHDSNLLDSGSTVITGFGEKSGRASRSCVPQRMSENWKSIRPRFPVIIPLCDAQLYIAWEKAASRLQKLEQYSMAPKSSRRGALKKGSTFKMPGTPASVSRARGAAALTAVPAAESSTSVLRRGKSFEFLCHLRRGDSFSTDLEHGGVPPSSGQAPQPPEGTLNHGQTLTKGRQRDLGAQMAAVFGTHDRLKASIESFNRVHLRPLMENVCAEDTSATSHIPPVADPDMPVPTATSTNESSADPDLARLSLAVNTFTTAHAKFSHLDIYNSLAAEDMTLELTMNSTSDELRSLINGLTHGGAKMLLKSLKEWAMANP